MSFIDRVFDNGQTPSIPRTHLYLVVRRNSSFIKCVCVCLWSNFIGNMNYYIFLQ